MPPQPAFAAALEPHVDAVPFAITGKPSDLANIPFIQLLGLMRSQQITFGIALRDKGVTMTNICFSTNHGDAAIAVCLDGLGAGLFLS